MRSRIILRLVAVLIFGAVVHGQKIKVDVDKSVDFTVFKTFAWAEGNIAPTASTGYLITAAVEKELASRGLVLSKENPDIRIDAIAGANMDLKGVGPSWNYDTFGSWGGYGNPGAMVTSAKGAVLLNFFDNRKNISVWRAIARDVFVLMPSGNREKDVKEMEETVNKTINNIFKKYPVKARK